MGGGSDHYLRGPVLRPDPPSNECVVGTLLMSHTLFSGGRCRSSLGLIPGVWQMSPSSSGKGRFSSGFPSLRMYVMS